MKTEMELVQSIIEHIRTNRIARTPMLEDLADAYANLCVEVNMRLMKCQDFLQKGMRSEAIYEATLSPALLEIVTVIQFQEFNRWRNICQELDISIPPQILVDIVERLTHELPKEQELEPLLKQYRRAVHHGEIRDSMDILRKIIPLDSANVIWKENLAALEDDYYDSQLADMEDALELNDLKALQRFYEDAIHPTRTLPFPTELLAKVRRALLAEQYEELLKRADAICLQLQGYIAEKRADLILPLLSQWTSLNNNEAFEAKAEHLAVITQANGVLAAHEKEQALLRKHEHMLDEFRAVLSPELPDTEEIAKLLEALRLEGIEIPEDLARYQEEAYRRIANHQRRRHRIIGSVVASCIAVGIICCGIVYANYHKQNVMEAKIVQVRDAYQQKDYQVAEELRKAIELDYPEVLSNGEYLKLKEDLLGALQRINEDNKSYLELYRALNAIAERGYSDKIADIKAKLTAIKELVNLTDEQKNRIAAWENQYLTYLNGIRDEVERSLRALCLKGDDVLDLFAVESQSTTRLEENLLKLKAVRSEFDAYRGKLDVAASHLQERWHTLFTELQTKEEEIANRISKMKSLAKSYDKAKGKIAENAENLTMYVNSLQAFVKEFPEAEEVPYYNRIINGESEKYQAVLLLKETDFRNMVAESAARQRLVDEIKQTYTGEKQCIWYNDLKTWEAFTQSSERLRNLVMGFGSDDATKEIYKDYFDVNYIRYREVGSSHWNYLYFPPLGDQDKPQELRWRRETNQGGVGVVERYWMDYVYRMVPGDTSGKRYEIVHSSKIFGNAMTSKNFEIHPDDFRQMTEANGSRNLVEPRKMLDRVCEEIASQDNGEEYLVTQIWGAILAAQNSNVYCPAYAALIKYWVECLYNSLGMKQNNPYQSVYDLTSNWDCRMTWFEAGHGKVAILRAKLTKDFVAVQEEIRRAYDIRQKQYKLTAYALSRQLVVAAMIDYNVDGKHVVRDTYALSSSESDEYELWALNTVGTPCFRKVGSRKGKYINISEDVLKTLKPGELLFAPTVKDLRYEEYFDEKGYIPESWPRKN